ncbi:MAG: hypothetical protein R3F13_11435 [Prosthecobacter sp.]
MLRAFKGHEVLLSLLLVSSVIAADAYPNFLVILGEAQGSASSSMMRRRTEDVIR